MATELFGDADEILGASYLLGYDDDLLGDEILGDEFLLGDDYDVMGAARRSRNPGQARAIAQMKAAQRQQRRNQLARLAQAKQAGAVAVKQTAPTKGRVLMVGFDSVATVAAATTIAITAQPQVLFRPRRLVLSDAAANAFVINDVRVGKDSQFVSAGAVPGSAFRPDAVAIDLQLDTCQIAASIVLNVTNISAAPARFMATMMGDSAE